MADFVYKRAAPPVVSGADIDLGDGPRVRVVIAGQTCSIQDQILNARPQAIRDVKEEG
jgi:hypothetical protein